MRACDHPDYEAERQYLADVLRLIDNSHELVVATGFSGGADGPATMTLRGLTHEQLGLDRVRASPYFGRIERESELVYIGYRGLREKGAAGRRLVIDWRAPVARLFYEPEPEIPGRRRYVIEQRQLQEIADDTLPAPGVPEGAGGGSIEEPACDPFLLRVLSAARDRKMRDIVPTIQGEQYRLVRAEAPITIIQGAPGTGKTIVALHRLAYMLHNARETHPDGRAAVAIFGPNRLFLNYISAVLPQLGERDALHTTFEDWFRGWAADPAIRFTSREAELEHMLDTSRSYRDRVAVFRRARLKGSLEMGQVIQRRVEILRQELLTSLLARPLPVHAASASAEPMGDALDVRTLRSVIQRLPDAPLNVQRQWARAELWRIAESSFAGSASRDGLTQDSHDSELREAKSLFEAEFDRRWPYTRFVELYRELLTNERALRSAAQRILKADEQRRLIARANDGVRVPNRQLTADSFPMEDAAPLAYACLVLNGPAQGPGGSQAFHHIVVDEAQDLAPLQFMVLHAHTAHMTILGDIAQGIHSYRGIRAWEELTAVFDGQTVLRTELKHSYRSTHQIVEFANSVLEKLSLSDVPPATPFPRHGEPPVLHACRSEADLAAVAARAIRRYLAEQTGRVAVICKTIAHAQQFAAQLRAAGIGRFAVLTSRNSGYSTEVVIVPAYLAKGMEFEAAIVVGANAQRYSNKEYDAKLFYIAVTRALHRLCVLWDGEPSPLLPAGATVGGR